MANQSFLMLPDILYKKELPNGTPEQGNQWFGF